MSTHKVNPFALPAPFESSEPTYTFGVGPNNVAMARNNESGESAAFVPNSAVETAIPECRRLSDSCRNTAETIAGWAREYRPEVFEQKVKNATTQKNAIIGNARQAWNAGMRYMDQTAAMRATLYAPPAMNPAVTTTLQSHFITLKSISEKMKFLESLEDWEVVAIAALSSSVIGLEKTEWDRTVGQRIMRHNIAVEMKRANPDSIYRDPTVTQMFPARATVSPDKLDAWVDSKLIELRERDSVMVGLQTVFESVFTFLKITFGLSPNDALDQILNRK
ncbi:MAG TPA: hypothetical protein VGC40_09120 [Paenirhodobacter sp.]